MDKNQRRTLAQLADEALGSGARGISLGLIYHPALFSDQRELLTLAQVAAAHHKPLVVHMRSESDEILEALQEPLQGIVGAVKEALEQTPPALGADVAERGAKGATWLM